MSRRYGNAQTIGCNRCQNTYFMTKQAQDGFLAVAADGTIDSVTGAYASILACEAIAKGFLFEGDIKALLEQQFYAAAALLSERLYKGRTPRVSVLAACFLRDRMIYQSVGEMSLVNFDGKKLTILQPGSGQTACRGITTLICNQGVWQALAEVEVETLLAGSGHPYQKAQKMIEKINQKGLKDQRSAVAVIVG